MSENEPERYSVEDLSLFSGKSLGSRALILVTGKRMVVTGDFGPEDPWRNKEVVDRPYIYEPLDLSIFTDLEKVW